MRKRASLGAVKQLLPCCWLVSRWLFPGYSTPIEQKFLEVPVQSPPRSFQGPPFRLRSIGLAILLGPVLSLSMP
jgi:hypothetical protein